jgi:hypothetical protein
VICYIDHLLAAGEAILPADLHAMMLAFRSPSAPTDAMRIHLLVVTRDQDDPDNVWSY